MDCPARNGDLRYECARVRRCAALLSLCAALFAFAGCSYDSFVQRASELAGQTGPDSITIRETPRNPLAESLDIFSTRGPTPTPRTVQLLRRFDLDDGLSGPMPALIARLQEATGGAKQADEIYAIAELAYIGGKQAQRAGNSAEALDLFGFSVAQSYFYLFDKQFDATRNPYDPQFRLACDLYNQSLESLLRMVKKKGGLRPGMKHRIDTGKNQYEVNIVSVGGWHDDDFDRFEFVSDYEIGGLTNQYHTFGLGVPLIGIRKRHQNEDAHEKFYPDGLSFPVTALLKVHPADAGEADPNAGDSQQTAGDLRRGYRVCALELIDPLVATDVALAGRMAPIESDLTTPLAYFLNQPRYRGNYLGTYALLRTDLTEEKGLRGLIMLEPYDPKKIPVVMVHGLWSTPITWVEMFNDLRSQKDIRERYQFWFYLYPTGQPYWISAAQMRYDLAEARKQLDPRHEATALDRMVLVGHSMGGLVSKLQTVDSGEEFWHVLTDRRFDELKADDATREKLRRVVYFDANPSIQRVITIATPHRGSNVSNSYTQWAARAIIRLPAMFMQTGEKLLVDNPNFFRHTDLLTTTTSVDSLSPNSPILPATFSAHPAEWVTYHNIVGLLPDDQASFLSRVSGRGDGVVGIESARWQQAVSEVVVNAEHSNVHRHPRAILEVARILREHMQSEIRLVREPPRLYNSALTGHSDSAASKPSESPAESTISDQFEPPTVLTSPELPQTMTPPAFESPQLPVYGPEPPP